MSAHTYWETTTHTLKDLITGHTLGYIQKVGTQWAVYTLHREGSNAHSIGHGLFSSALAAKSHLRITDAIAEGRRHAHR